MANPVITVSELPPVAGPRESVERLADHADAMLTQIEESPIWKLLTRQDGPVAQWLANITKENDHAP